MLAGATGTHTLSAVQENNKCARLKGGLKWPKKLDIVYARSLIEKKMHFYFDLEMYEFWTTQVFYKNYKQAENNNMYLT